MNVKALVALALVAAVAAAAFSTGATGGTSPTTHVGVSVGDLVVLRGSQQSVSGPFRFVRIGPTGAITADFVVPTGKILIVTDVAWFKNGSVGAGTAYIFALGVGSQALHIEPVNVGTSGIAMGTQHLTTGFALGQGQRLQVFVTPGGTAGLDVTVQGYLVP